MKTQFFEKTLILLIIFIGFGLRAGLLSVTADIPLRGDEGQYNKLGRLLAQDFRSGLTANRFLKTTPLLPLMLAGMRITIGPQPYHGKWLMVFMGTTSVALGFGLGRRLFGQRAGLATGAILAIYPEFVVSSTLLFTEVPFIALNLASFILLVEYISRPRTRILILASLFWAATILTRDQALYFTPLLSLWIAWNYRGRPRQRLLVAIGFLFIVLIGLSPWIGRNLLVTGRLAFVTQREGITLFRRPGNHDPQLDLNSWCQQWKALRDDHSAQQRLAINTFLDYIRQNPGRWLANKAQLFWANFSQVYIESFRRIQLGIYGQSLPQYTLLLLWITGLALLVFAGGWAIGLFSAPASGGRNLLFLWLAYSIGLYILVALLVRNRSVLLATLSFFAGYFFANPLAALTQLRTRPLAGILAFGLLVLFVTSLNVYPFEQPAEINPCIPIK